MKAAAEDPSLTPATRAAVAARDLWRGFGRERVLRGVSLEVPAGGALAVFGPNGSGKSTLLRALAGLLRPQRGAVLVAGEELFADPRARRRIGYVGHEPMLYGGLTVEENLRLFAALYGLAAPRPRIDEVCALLGLTGYRGTVAGRLSRGLSQRAAVARAILHRPVVLILDEPFAGLDPDAASQLAAHLDRFRGDGGTVVLATHQAAEAIRLGGEARVLAGGRLGPPLPLDGLDAAAVDAWYRAR
ncbi:MAG TPA: heme ABC exporter ATP-binding protein CcmA [bacterium]|nr:heme ABC exporter ATP-binding protein CcmA [bacterium]